MDLLDLLDRWKERALFFASLAAAVLYFGLGGGGGRAAVHVAWVEQEQKVKLPQRPAVPTSGVLFAAGDRQRYWDESIPRKWVQVKAPEPEVEVRLDLPRPAIIEPPLLLPIPGPRLPFARDLPRWGEYRSVTDAEGN